MLAIALVLANAIAWFAVIEPTRALVAQQRTDNHALADALASRLTTTDVKRSPEEQLQRFYGFLPGVRQLPADLAYIRAAASRHGVAIDQGEFRLVPDPDGRVLQYQMIFPIKAGYPKTRAFISDVMRKLPSAALEEISFRREGIGNRELESRLRFVLFLSNPPRQ